jgi:hypothetical protein
MNGSTPHVARPVEFRECSLDPWKVAAEAIMQACLLYGELSEHAVLDLLHAASDRQQADATKLLTSMMFEGQLVARIVYVPGGPIVMIARALPVAS